MVTAFRLPPSVGRAVARFRPDRCVLFRDGALVGSRACRFYRSNAQGAPLDPRDANASSVVTYRIAFDAETSLRAGDRVTVVGAGTWTVGEPGEATAYDVERVATVTRPVLATETVDLVLYRTSPTTELPVALPPVAVQVVYDDRAPRTPANEGAAGTYVTGLLVGPAGWDVQEGDAFVLPPNLPGMVTAAPAATADRREVPFRLYAAGGG